MAQSGKAFGSLLDELLARDTHESEARRSASISADILTVGGPDGAAALPDGDVAAEYLLSAVRDQVERDIVETLSRIEIAAPPSIEPDDIARELGLDGPPATPRDLDRVRREFAFANHPDRVDAALRERAMIRMQIANRLIDEAKARQARA